MSDIVIAEIAAERRRQIEIEGWTPEHDDWHADGEIARAAAVYACAATLDDKTRTSARLGPQEGWINVLWWLWPRGWGEWHFKLKDRRHDLIRAAALIVAEIERLDRASGAEHGDEGQGLISHG